MHQHSKKSFDFFFFAKLLILSFIFCLPKVEVKDDLLKSTYQFQKGDKEALLLINHSHLETKVVKKSSFIQDLYLNTETKPFFFSYSYDFKTLHFKDLKTTLFSVSLKARAPPIYS